MKLFIKERLNILLEAVTNKSTFSDYLKMKYLVNYLTKTYKDDSYFMGENIGDFIAAAIVDIKGNVSIRQTAKVPAGDLKANRLGLTRETKDYLQFYIRAGRGIEHPDTYKPRDVSAQTRQGIYSKTFKLQNPIKDPSGEIIDSVTINPPKPNSPASDAQIKTYLLYGPQIIDFVEKNLANPIGYNDDKGGEIRNSMDFNKKLQIIRKDAEDQVINSGLGRVGFTHAWEEFKQSLENLNDEDKAKLDTTKTTKDLLNFYRKIKGPSAGKSEIGMGDKEKQEFERQQKEKAERLARFKARQNR